MSEKFDLEAAREELRAAEVASVYGDDCDLAVFALHTGRNALTEIARLTVERDAYKQLWDQACARLSAIQDAVNGKHDVEVV